MRGARMKVGLTQAEAARQIGVSRQTLSNWENEKTYADIAQLLIISHVYGTDVDELLKGGEALEVLTENKTPSAPCRVQAWMKWLPLILYGVAAVLFCGLTWYTEIKPFQGTYSPGPLTVLWIYTFLPIISMFATVWISASTTWKAGRWYAVGAMHLIQAGIHYFWLYKASRFYYTQTDRPIDHSEMIAETVSFSAISVLLGIGIGTLIRFLKPKITHWLKGLD